VARPVVGGDCTFVDNVERDTIIGGDLAVPDAPVTVPD
jgi:hypothetical protein